MTRLYIDNSKFLVDIKLILPPIPEGIYLLQNRRSCYIPYLTVTKSHYYFTYNRDGSGDIRRIDLLYKHIANISEDSIQIKDADDTSYIRTYLRIE